MQVQVVILAAGQGKRMQSKLPKVLHPLAGKPMLEQVVTTAEKIAPNREPIVVYGHQGVMLQEKLSHLNVSWVKQIEQLGTGHAVLQALPEISDEDNVLVLYGDVPLISEETLQRLIATTPEKQAIGMLTAFLSHPKGYGRIKREKDKIVAIVEEKDATDDERMINEINPGIYFMKAAYLKKWLPTLQNKNAQGEYYLTDVIELAVKENLAIHAVHPLEHEEIMGVNDRAQLAHLERFYQRRQAEKLMHQGVTLMDPARVDIRGELKVGQDVSIDINVIFEGQVTIGNDCVIGPNCVLRNVTLGDRVEVKANCVLDGAKVGADSIIGPFARLRPETVLANQVHIGNFVEIKKSTIATGSKVNHLSYMGDCEIGKQVNVGAGTITCNYDGVNKHKTYIGDHAFIGSCTQLVAPVTVGEGATIGAGSTITEDAPPRQLTLARVKQFTISEWQRPEKVTK